MMATQISNAARDQLFEALIFEEPLSPDQETLLTALEADPAEWQALQRELQLYRQLPAGEPLPVSLVYPPDADTQPELPAGMMARLLAIPDTNEPLPASLAGLVIPPESPHSAPPVASVRAESAGQVSARPATTPIAATPDVFVSPRRPSQREGTLERLLSWLQEFWQLLVRQPAYGMAAMAALLLMVLLPELRQMPGMRGNIGGDASGGAAGDGGLVPGMPFGASGLDGIQKGTAPRGTGTAVSLSLVSRMGPEAPIYRLPLESLGNELYGVKARTGQTVLPVLQHLDGNLQDRYSVVILVEAAGPVHVLQRGESPISAQLLPGTEHLFALPEPVVLRSDAQTESPSTVGSSLVGQARLYVLLTPSRLSDEALDAALKNAVNATHSPRLLLEGPEGIGAVEGTLLMELSP